MKLTVKRPEAPESVLMARLMIRGQALKFYTGRTLKKGNWSKTKQAALSGADNCDLLNQYLSNWKSELSKIIEEYRVQKLQLNQKAIQDTLNIRMNITNADAQKKALEGKHNDFISFINSYIKTKQAKKREVQKLQQSRKLLILAFKLTTEKTISDWERLNVKEKSVRSLETNKPLPFEEVNLKFIEAFRTYLLTTKYKTSIKGQDIWLNYKINYIDKQVKGLKQFITAAIEDGYVKAFTWKSLKAEDVEVDSVYTDFEEIQMIFDTELTNSTEMLVRDKYVTNCFLGMRYSDFNRLEPHSFKRRTIKGKEFVVYVGRAKKTDSKVEFALPPIALTLLTKYDFNLPKLSAKEYNEVLKRVAFKAGLTGLERIREIRGTEKIEKDVPKYELMSSHTARRSFCTNYYVEGVSISAIMSISGHTTEEEFRRYIKKPVVNVEVVAEQISAIKGINHLRVA